MEQLDIFDENGKRIGSASRSRVHAEGLLHQTAHCWIIGETEPVLYMQQRAWDKTDFAGCFDIACGGHIAAGEQPRQAMLRELEEELGLVPELEELIYLGQYRAPDYHLDGWHDRTLANVFALRCDRPPFRIGSEVERMLRVKASDFAHMELDYAEFITVQTGEGAYFPTHRDAWCCHDGEFAAIVLPYLRQYGSFAAAGD